MVQSVSICTWSKVGNTKSYLIVEFSLLLLIERKLTNRNMFNYSQDFKYSKNCIRKTRQFQFWAFSIKKSKIKLGINKQL